RSLDTSRETPVAALAAIILAPLMTAPVGSATVPLSSAVETCARESDAENSIKGKKRTIRLPVNIAATPETGFPSNIHLTAWWMEGSTIHFGVARTLCLPRRD